MYPRRRRKLSYIDHFAHWLACRNAKDENDVVVKLEAAREFVGSLGGAGLSPAKVKYLPIYDTASKTGD
jgi:hypothetical protein